MEAVFIAEPEPFFEAVAQIGTALKGVQIEIVIFHRSPQPFDEDVSLKLPRPSMLIFIRLAESTSVKSLLVN